jgi:hypothetical protein
MDASRPHAEADAKRPSKHASLAPQHEGLWESYSIQIHHDPGRLLDALSLVSTFQQDLIAPAFRQDLVQETCAGSAKGNRRPRRILHKARAGDAMVVDDNALQHRARRC